MSEGIDRENLSVEKGRTSPLGATPCADGVRFAIFSRNAEKVWLALFNNADDANPALEIEFDPKTHRFGDIWSVYIKGLKPGTLYAYKMDGPVKSCFDKTKTLLDPYAKLIVGDTQSQNAKCVVVEDEKDWLDDVLPKTPFNETIIYETHVRGLTIQDDSVKENKGSYLGLIEKIPYFKELGVTAIELLPIHECGERSLRRCSISTRRELTNYWGYNSIGFFTPAARFASEPGGASRLSEFRQMVAALHKAGLEIFLDVVFNHTAEGSRLGPTLSFRGIDDAVYYIRDESGDYANYSGCGNTVNCNHPVVQDFIIDCLRYWTTTMHVDGFRFDLGCILGRNGRGHLLDKSPLLERIAEDPVLRGVKLIAEPWDIGGYQLGRFGTPRWTEWNGRFRDDVRRYWLGDHTAKGDLACRITASSDLYQQAGKSPVSTINFVTSHDGFTLHDVVTYSHKHNEANGENGMDGENHNINWNCGVEGETDDPEINELRTRLKKNFLATLLLSVGVPMISGGDEFCRTQLGNNNAYCQDNDISWYDWSLLDKNRPLFNFCRELIRFRKANPALTRAKYFTGEQREDGTNPDLLWFDARGKPQNWDPNKPKIACRIDGSVNNDVPLYLMFNPTEDSAKFRVPKGTWYIRINTAEAPPNDIVEEDAQVVKGAYQLPLSPRSLVVLSHVPHPHRKHRSTKHLPEKTQT